MTTLPDLPDRLNGEGLVHAANGRKKPAQAAFRQACALSPSHLAAIGNLANLETRRLSLDAALRHYRWGLALAPHLAQLHLMLATAEIHSGAALSASVSLHRALVLSPAYGNALINLGLFLTDVAQQMAGVRLFRRALACEPQSELAFAGCIRALSQEGQLVPVPPLLHRALTTHPSSALLHASAAEFYVVSADLPSALRHLRHAIALDAENSRTHQQLFFTLVLDPDISDEGLFKAYRSWARRHAPATPAKPSVERSAERTLNVGYLSADLYDHPIAFLTEDLISHHDRAQIRPWLFATGFRYDATSRRLAASAHAWRSVAALSDEAAARLIAAEGIDILVILTGHTGSNRILIAAQRPAPIQVNLHDISTTGLDAVDYWLTDRYLHPEDTTEGRTETLWRIDSLYMHRWPEGVPVASPLPALGRGFVTFGCFASPAKVNDRVLALWARVLRNVPESRILFAYRQAFADPFLRDRFRRRLEAHGIERSRVGFDLRRLTRAEHLARAASVDISLDPFPYNGGTATFEAFAVGVPIVALAGSRFLSRGGVTHLAQVGLPHLIAATEDEYAGIAVALAGDLPALARLRGELPARTRASPLGNAQAYARSVEAAYRGMWRRYCAEAGG